jgi:hypothetical protein
LVHVFTCSHPSATYHRQTRLAELCRDLDTAGTPLPVVQAVRHGFTKWDSDPTMKSVRALTTGSLRGADAVLTTAFREQFTFIGWYHLCLGQISKKWALAGQHYVPPRAHTDGSLHWASIFIKALWKYSKALWAFWNEIVSGATVEEQVNRQREPYLFKRGVQKHKSSFLFFSKIYSNHEKNTETIVPPLVPQSAYDLRHLYVSGKDGIISILLHQVYS